MSRPANVRGFGSPFVKQKKKSGSKKLGLDHLDYESSNHRANDLRNAEELRFLRIQLSIAEREGKYSRARKLRRAINQHLEIGLYIRNSWCYGCNNVLHNCQCKDN
jgi:hypothetical protein